MQHNTMQQNEARKEKQYRIALWTPLPPQKTGIADYVNEMLVYLNDRFDIEIFVDPNYQIVIPLLSTKYKVFYYTHYDIRHKSDPFDLNIYQMGNNVFHLYIYEQAIKIPGLVVLHDFSISSVLYHYYVDIWRDLAVFQHELLYSEGTDALSRFQIQISNGNNQGVIQELSKHGMLRRLIENNFAIITHLAHTANLLKTRYQMEHARSMFLGSPDPFEELMETDAKTLREKLNLPLDALVVGVFGHIQRTKQISVILRALARLKSRYPRLKVLLVGEINPAEGYDEYLRNLISELNVADNLILTGFVTKLELLQYMLAADIHVNLRYPSFGQMSATLSRGIASGKPIIVTDLPEWRFLPDDFCWKVPAEDIEGIALEKYLERLLQSPELVKERGESARSYFLAEGTMKTAADRLSEVVVHIIQNPSDYVVHKSEEPPPVRVPWEQQILHAFEKYQKARTTARSPFGKKLREIPLIGRALYIVYYFYSSIKNFNQLYHSDLYLHQLFMNVIIDNTIQIRHINNHIPTTPIELPDMDYPQKIRKHKKSEK